MGIFSRLRRLFGGDTPDTTPYKYELIAGKEPGKGRGYYVRQISDQKTIPWRSLSKKDGLESFRIAGISFYREDANSGLCSPGWGLVLLPEPNNPHDPDAIALWDMNRNSQLGYVPAAQAKRIGENLRAGQYKYCLSVWWQLGDNGPFQIRALLVSKDASLKLYGTVKAAAEHPKASLRKIFSPPV